MVNPTIVSLGRRSQKDCYKFKTSFGYTVTPRIANTPSSSLSLDLGITFSSIEGGSALTTAPVRRHGLCFHYTAVKSSVFSTFSSNFLKAYHKDQVHEKWTHYTGQCWEEQPPTSHNSSCQWPPQAPKVNEKTALVLFKMLMEKLQNEK